MARAAVSPPAASGHFDELRGRVPPASGQSQSQSQNASRSIAEDPEMARAWRQFFEECETDGLGDMNQRAANLERQIRDNGVTYNVYADEGGPQRPWSLGLFPLIVSAQSWQQIEAGVTQRARLLDRVMADVYGPQDLLAQGLLPPALVQGHPGYLR
ncbi:MAG: circularly permuted type 2 ATP-grasp protein, partial [Rhodoferax sp.]